MVTPADLRVPARASPEAAGTFDPFEVETIELGLLLGVLAAYAGADLRSYARAALAERARALLPSYGCATLSELTGRVLRDGALTRELVGALRRTECSMFRDPFAYRALRDRVLPLLRTWPSVKVWHVGCGTGEETWSLAVLLSEAGLAARTMIYATDADPAALAKARDGIYPAERVREFTQDYQASGGQRSFSDHYLARYGAVVMAPALKARVSFAVHDLVTDASFGEMQVVVCRNVLLAFDHGLAGRALGVIADSLVHGGVLWLGTHEILPGSPAAAGFEGVDAEARLFRRVVRP